MKEEGIMRQFVRKIPNIITVLRLLLTVCIVLSGFGTNSFYAMYLLAGISDCIDGFLARKMKAETELGARLDTIADAFLFLVVMIKVFPFILKMYYVVVSIIVIAIIRGISMLICWNRFHTITMLHTYSNKLAGFSVFMVPFLQKSKDNTLFIAIIIGIAIYSSIEELMIQWKSPSLDVNRKSFWRD